MNFTPEERAIGKENFHDAVGVSRRAFLKTAAAAPALGAFYFGYEKLKGKPVKVGFAAYYEELGRVGLVDECAPKGYKQVSISGRELREKLRAGVMPDARVMRPETAKILIERMKNAV